MFPRTPPRLWQVSSSTLPLAMPRERLAGLFAWGSQGGLNRFSTGAHRSAMVLGRSCVHGNGPKRRPRSRFLESCRLPRLLPCSGDRLRGIQSPARPWACHRPFRQSCNRVLQQSHGGLDGNSNTFLLHRRRFFDLGFKQAGFSVCWTNENHPAFVSGYEHGMSSWLSSLNKKRRVNAKISNTSSVCDLSARQVLNEAFSGPRPSVFGVIGGPPCPDFSNGGTHAGGNGSNGMLTTIFVDMLCSLRPAFFVIENVPGLHYFHKHRGFLSRKIGQLQEHGYAVDYRILNALELGVPQNRERLFVIGFKRPLAEHAAGRKLTAYEHGWFLWPEIETYTGAKLLPWPKLTPFGKKPKCPPRFPLNLRFTQRF